MPSARRTQNERTYEIVERLACGRYWARWTLERTDCPYCRRPLRLVKELSMRRRDEERG